MRILADQHISPRTVEVLRGLGHDAIRVTDRLPRHAADVDILSVAATEDRVVLTQDLDFTGLVATGKQQKPSLIILRLGSPSVEHVNGILRSVLPLVEEAVRAGAIVSVDADRVRVRRLPIQ